jgi:hypothetical protein
MYHILNKNKFLQICQSSAKRDAQCVPQWDATPKGEANPLKARSVRIEGCKSASR